ncbi:MAG: DUF4386 domain-containing protein [Vicinamibacteria bacterium]
MTSRKKTARTAGWIYLAVAVTGGFSMLYVPSLIVAGDAPATLRNLAASEGMFRLGLVCGLACQALFVFLGLALYRLLAEVDRPRARVMVGLVITGAAVAFLNMLNQVPTLVVMSGAPYLEAFDLAQRQALAMFFLGLHAEGIVLSKVFFGLWLIPLGLLIVRSGFLPKPLGVLLIVGGVGYVIDVLVHFLAPQIAPAVTPIATAPSGLAEIGLIFWLLIKGARDEAA